MHKNCDINQFTLATDDHDEDSSEEDFKKKKKKRETAAKNSVDIANSQSSAQKKGSIKKRSPQECGEKFDGMYLLEFILINEN